MKYFIIFKEYVIEIFFINEKILNTLSILYPVSYKIKFSSKKNSKDYVVPPLEGLWWADNLDDFTEGNRDKWKWTMMMMVPKWIDQGRFVNALEIMKEKN